MMAEKTLNVMETAQMISCSRSHVYRLVDAGEISGYCTGQRKGIRIIESSVEAFVARRKSS